MVFGHLHKVDTVLQYLQMANITSSMHVFTVLCMKCIHTLCKCVHTL